ncbi:MAG: hypothetical protein SFU91_13420 [Chloroherpetonaceae bacterium]|nr:hypothetical protein [Chloroherpetonaceae bacterium]
MKKILFLLLIIIINACSNKSENKIEQEFIEKSEQNLELEYIKKRDNSIYYFEAELDKKSGFGSNIVKLNNASLLALEQILKDILINSTKDSIIKS